jgi:sterol 3beta-glucosyltransferase
MDRETPVPPPGLEEFLGDGPTPVCIGFGSMVGRRPEELTQLAVDALDRAGTRGVLLSGWGGLTTTTLPLSVFQVESVSHEWLYPRVAAVVHHGGSGTTAAAVRAGVPSIITPFGFDQSLWGRRIAELGIGPEPIPQQELTAERLADAIRIATRTESMRTRAAALAIKVRRENGVGRAIELFEQYAEVPF